MLFSSGWSLPSPSLESASSIDEMMLSAASTSSQHQPNFWFPASPLPSFFSSSSVGNPVGHVQDKLAYMQPNMPPNPNSSTNKIHFDINACSSSSESSPPLSNDFLHSRSNPASLATTLNLTQFNYIQQNHHHHPSLVSASTNSFLSRDDWSQSAAAAAAMAVPTPTTTNASTNAAWHTQHPTKGNNFLFSTSYSFN